MLSANRYTQKHVYSLSNQQMRLEEQTNYLLDACELYCKSNLILQKSFETSINTINQLNVMKKNKNVIKKESG